MKQTTSNPKQAPAKAAAGSRSTSRLTTVLLIVPTFNQRGTGVSDFPYSSGSNPSANPPSFYPDENDNLPCLPILEDEPVSAPKRPLLRPRNSKRQAAVAEDNTFLGPNKLGSFLPIKPHFRTVPNSLMISFKHRSRCAEELLKHKQALPFLHDSFDAKKRFDRNQRTSRHI
jgi:hypothetical protein